MISCHLYKSGERFLLEWTILQENLEKDCQERTEQSRTDNNYGQNGGTKQGRLNRQCDRLMHLLTVRAMMIMIMIGEELKLGNHVLAPTGLAMAMSGQEE